MRYSFKQPSAKNRLDLESKIILIFLIVTLLLVGGFTLFLLLKKNNIHSDTIAMKQKISILKKENMQDKNAIARINRLSQKYEAISTNNTLLKESIHNLFDLIPDQITLTKAILNKDGLVLYGVTPSKDIYNYLLLAPLKSVFGRNITTFYPLKNGWFRFVSVNEGSIEAGNEVEK